MQFLRRLWEVWKPFGRFVGNQIARVVLSVFYFTIFVPYGLGVRLFGDPLQMKTRPNSLWRPRSTGDPTLAEAGRQF
jgi:hypothetical protein